jgi:hypothetical protein
LLFGSVAILAGEKQKTVAITVSSIATSIGCGGVKDIRDYIGGGIKFLGYAKTALGVLVIFSNALAQHSTKPMAQSALAELAELKADTEALVADLEAQEGAQHTREEAQGMQARLSAIVDRIEAIRTQADEILPSPAASRLEPFEMA